MKKYILIVVLMVIVVNVNADNIFATGYYIQNNQKVAALYKNGTILYTVHHEGKNTIPKTMVSDANDNVYWMVNVFDGSSFRYTEVWKNDQLYVSTQNLSGVRIIDIYCLNDTLYYAGHYTNDKGVTVATVWKGNDFTTHWQLGDGIHQSFLYDADVDRQTDVPYFCGYVTDGKRQAVVWQEGDLLFTCQEDDGYGNEITSSYVTEISVDEGHVYTLGIAEMAGMVDIYVIYRDGVFLYTTDSESQYSTLCAFAGDVYFGYTDPHGMQYYITKNFQQTMLNYGITNSGAYNITSISSDIYVCGVKEGKGCIWKNFAVYQQPENCAELFDMVVVETSNPPDNYYGYLCQPDSAILYLNPNQPYEANNDQMYAGFRYKSNGLLERSYVETYLDYGHWMFYYYDTDYHTIKELDSYFDPMPAGFQNYYTYENGLLMTYARYYNDYHEDNSMVIQDSITYAYDELRRLQTEKRFISTTSEKNYEYYENQVVITTYGYSSGTWTTLSRETRTFSENSLLLSSETKKYNDSAVLVTYGYDEQRHRTRVLTQKRNNGVWENQKLVQYHFNPYGRLILAEIKLWQENDFVNAHRAIYELNEMGYPAVVTFEKWDGEAWVTGVWQPDFYLYDEDHLKQHNNLLYRYKSSIHKIEMVYRITENPREPFVPDNSEWYYEILNDDGSTTYQYLHCVGDTTISGERPKIIVRTNQIYDKNRQAEVTREYVFEKDGVVYWWNKELEEFTVLYNLNAEVGDEWEIKVGTESIVMHVDAVEQYEYEGRNYKMLRVSDIDDVFSGNIVCGISHLTSFFPEKLMHHGKGYRVEGIRCYWLDGTLVFRYGDKDCDAIYEINHHSVGETVAETGFLIYPNPTDGLLRVVGLPPNVGLPQCDSPTVAEYRITNVMGQTLMIGRVETHHGTSLPTTTIDVSSLPAGMYFIQIDHQTSKFIKQ